MYLFQFFQFIIITVNKEEQMLNETNPEIHTVLSVEVPYGD